MAFQYVEGDFPEGTYAECKAGDWVLVLGRGTLFKAPERVPLRAQVRSVEICRAQGDCKPSGENEGLGWVARGLSGGSDAAQQVVQRAGAMIAESFSGFSAPWSNKVVPVLCVLQSGKFFVANVSKKNFEWLTNQSLVSQSAQRFRNADFAEAAMAMCALMCTLDGWVDGSRKAKLGPLLEGDERLKTFARAELEGKFAGYCRSLLSDAAMGRKGALDCVAKLEGKEELARAVIRLGLATRGDVDPLDAREGKIVREACGLVGIYPGEFGLFYSG